MRKKNAINKIAFEKKGVQISISNISPQMYMFCKFIWSASTTDLQTKYVLDI